MECKTDYVLSKLLKWAKEIENIDHALKTKNAASLKNTRPRQIQGWILQTLYWITHFYSV